MTREGLIEVMARAQVAYLYPTTEGYPGYDDLTPEAIEILHACATAALSAIEAAGVRLVPDQPTHEMQFAGGTCQGGTEHEGEGEADTIVFPAVIYRAMLAASPYAPAQKDESHE